MDTTQLQVVSEERDLGMIVSDDLKWEKQCTAAETSKQDTWNDNA